MAIFESGINPQLNFYCPKCKSNNVILEEKERYYRVCKCKSCGFVNEIKD